MADFFKTMLVAFLAIAALPSAAWAGTSTATANVTMQVGSQCTLTGANIHLGSFYSTDTWGTVGGRHGSAQFGIYSAGTAGSESLNFGSVACDQNLPWSLTIKGTNTGLNAVGAIKITLNGKVAVLWPAIKRVGSTTFSDTWSNFPGTGVQVWLASVSGIGTGAPQDLKGNVTLGYSAVGVTATSTTALGAVGSASDTLTYTLTF